MALTCLGDNSRGDRPNGHERNEGCESGDNNTCHSWFSFPADQI